MVAPWPFPPPKKLFARALPSRERSRGLSPANRLPRCRSFRQSNGRTRTRRRGRGPGTRTCQPTLQVLLLARSPFVSRLPFGHCLVSRSIDGLTTLESVGRGLVTRFEDRGLLETVCFSFQQKTNKRSNQMRTRGILASLERLTGPSKLSGHNDVSGLRLGKLRVS